MQRKLFNVFQLHKKSDTVCKIDVTVSGSASTVHMNRGCTTSTRLDGQTQCLISEYIKVWFPIFMNKVCFTFKK